MFKSNGKSELKWKIKNLKWNSLKMIKKNTKTKTKFWISNWIYVKKSRSNNDWSLRPDKRHGYIIIITFILYISCNWIIILTWIFSRHKQIYKHKKYENKCKEKTKVKRKWKKKKYTSHTTRNISLTKNEIFSFLFLKMATLYKAIFYSNYVYINSNF